MGVQQGWHRIPLQGLLHLSVWPNSGETNGAGGDASASHIEVCRSVEKL